MLFKHPISLLTIIRFNPLEVAATWLMVLAENVMLILLPIFIGYAIDGVLNQSFQPLMMLALILVILSVVRRFYDTRVYGAIRVKLANIVERNLRGLSVSTKDARLTMSRELVDFLGKLNFFISTACFMFFTNQLIICVNHQYQS